MKPGSIGAAARRNIAVLFGGQAMSTAATSVSIALGSIVATQLTGSARFSGVPATLNLLASAAAAYAAGRVMAAYGRRLGLTLGYLTGALGAALAAFCAFDGNFFGFLAGSALVGAANGTIALGRYAAAELVPERSRGRVVGLMLFGSVAGALLTAALAPMVARIAQTRHLSAIDLGWLLGAIMLAIGAAIVGALFRATPPLSETGTTRSADEPARTRKELFALPKIRLAVANLVCGQAVMVMLMDLIPLHASHMGEGLPAISQLLSAHFTGMFAFAWLSGWMADRWGARPVSLLGALQLGAGALLAIRASGAFELGAALFLIGLGWNFCYVAGSALLAGTLRPSERPRTQGTADLWSWLSAAASTAGGGFLFGVYGFGVVGAIGICASVILLCAVVLSRGMARADP